MGGLQVGGDLGGFDGGAVCSVRGVGGNHQCGKQSLWLVTSPTWASLRGQGVSQLRSAVVASTLFSTARHLSSVWPGAGVCVQHCVSLFSLLNILVCTLVTLSVSAAVELHRIGNFWSKLTFQHKCEFSAQQDICSCRESVVTKT